MRGRVIHFVATALRHDRGVQRREDHRLAVRRNRRRNGEGVLPWVMRLSFQGGGHTAWATDDLPSDQWQAMATNVELPDPLVGWPNATTSRGGHAASALLVGQAAPHDKMPIFA